MFYEVDGRKKDPVAGMAWQARHIEAALIIRDRLVILFFCKTGYYGVDGGLLKWKQIYAAPLSCVADSKGG